MNSAAAEEAIVREFQPWIDSGLATVTRSFEHNVSALTIEPSCRSAASIIVSFPDPGAVGLAVGMHELFVELPIEVEKAAEMAHLIDLLRAVRNGFEEKIGVTRTGEVVSCRALLPIEGSSRFYRLLWRRARWVAGSRHVRYSAYGDPDSQEPPPLKTTA